MQENNSAIVSLYVVKTVAGTYFAGFDSSKGKASFSEDPRFAKMFTNKYDIKLRPDEMLVELSVNLENVDVAVSEPFRPRLRMPKPQQKV